MPSPHAGGYYFGGNMAKGIMCSCGCKSIVYDINPKTNKPYGKCEKSRSQQVKRASKIRKTQRKNMDHAKRPNGSLIYDTRAWRRLSDKKRTVDPFCECCAREGKMVLANLVDHKKEIRDGGDPYNWDNLESLCHACHNAKTRDEAKTRNNLEGVYVI